MATGTRNRRTAVVLSLVVVGMFGFGFAMVPLYDLICKVTGVQSVALRTGGERSEAVPMVAPDPNRWVTIKFDTTVAPSLPWEFEAGIHRVEVVPGEINEVVFLARNRSNSQVTGQAIPSVVPWQATPFFSKLECFCFNKQTLVGGERVEMPLRFMVSPDLPKGIESLTLSYNFMKLKPSQGGVAEPKVTANDQG
ncbi:MAG: cytochrome c oxidase assembly protein [Gammaproteobacteria bacterium]|nr:cytochrome c oxidase assembly protein [Gammaproteobacteria bacterium]